MKKLIASLYFLIPGLLSTTFAQTPDDLLHLLTQKGTITQQEADSLRIVYAGRKLHEERKQDSFPLSLGRVLHLSGYTQVRYQYYQQSGKNSGFDVRRARLDFQGDFSSKWAYRLLIDFTGAAGAAGTAATGGALIAPQLLDGYVAYKPFDFLKITAGQFTIPFSMENITADRALELADRSQAINALMARKGDISNGIIDSIGNQIGRDIGLQLSGSFIKIKNRYLADYWIALLDGAGINTLDNNGYKDVAARLVIHPFSKLDIGASIYNGKDRFINSTGTDKQRNRWGLEAALNLKTLSLKTEFIHGTEGKENTISHAGWYAQGAWFIWPRHLQTVIRYDEFRPNTNAHSILPLYRYYIIGINYFFNVWTKLQVNYSMRTETPSVPNDVLTVQMQLAF